MSKPHPTLFEPLELRRLLAVSFTASAPAAPTINTPDTPLGILSWGLSR